MRSLKKLTTSVVLLLAPALSQSPSSLIRKHCTENPKGCIVIDASPFLWEIVRELQSTWSYAQWRHGKLVSPALEAFERALAETRGKDADLASQVRVARGLLRGDPLPGSSSDVEAEVRAVEAGAQHWQPRFAPDSRAVAWPQPPGRFARNEDTSRLWRATYYLWVYSLQWSKEQMEAWRRVVQESRPLDWWKELSFVEARLAVFGGGTSILSLGSCDPRQPTWDESLLLSALGATEFGLSRLLQGLAADGGKAMRRAESLRGCALDVMSALLRVERPVSPHLEFPRDGGWRDLDADAASYVYVGCRELDPMAKVPGGSMVNEDIVVVVDPRREVWEAVCRLRRITWSIADNIGLPQGAPDSLEAALKLVIQGVEHQDQHGLIAGTLRRDLMDLAMSRFSQPYTDRTSVALECGGSPYRRAAVSLVQRRVVVAGIPRDAAVIRLGVEVHADKGEWRMLEWKDRLECVAAEK